MVKFNTQGHHASLPRSYTKFIIGFIALTVLVLFIIFYYSLSQALIKITPRPKPLTADFIADIETQTAKINPTALSGLLYATEVNLTQTVDATGTKSSTADTIGEVIIYNQQDKAQPLVATTRLITPDGILLRIKNRITVPAKGSLSATVYADDPSAFTTLAPTTFIVPGLSETLQKVVYAESKVTLNSKPGQIKVVKATDISRGRDALAEAIYSEALTRAKKEFGDKTAAVIVNKKLIDETASVKVDTVADKFQLTQKMQVTVLGINQSDILKLAVSRLQEQLVPNYELRDLKSDKLSYLVQNYDEANKTAKVKIHAEADSVLKADSPILDKEKLTGLSIKGVQLYLSSFDEIEKVEVDLSPFWVSKIPSFADHITVQVLP